jgi:hypothetical protein
MIADEEIASRLGYSDAANFRPAFLRWTGKSPSDFRVSANAFRPAPAPRPAASGGTVLCGAARLSIIAVSQIHRSSGSFAPFRGAGCKIAWFLNQGA